MCSCNFSKYAYTAISLFNGSLSIEFAVNGLFHVPLSQNQPTKVYPSLVGFAGITIISLPFVCTFEYSSSSTTKRIYGVATLLFPLLLLSLLGFCEPVSPHAVKMHIKMTAIVKIVKMLKIRCFL